MNRPSTMSILLFFVFSSYAWPQTELATVFGTVTDPNGAVIAQPQVTLLNQTSGLKRDSSTDSTANIISRGCRSETTLLAALNYFYSRFV